MKWDFTKFVKKLPLPQEAQVHLGRLLPVPVNPYVKIDSGFSAQRLRDAAGHAGKALETSTYVRLGQGLQPSFTATLLLKKFPKEVLFGHFRELANSVPVRYQVDIHPIAQNIVSRSNENRLNRLRHAIEEAEANHQIPDSELVKAYQSLKEVINQVDYTDNLAFDIWFYITTWARDERRLVDNVRNIKKWLGTYKVRVYNLYFQQAEGLRANLTLGRTPAGFTKEYPGRLATSDPLTFLNPYMDGTISDGQGVPFGNSTRDNSFIFFDLKRGQGGKNIAILGSTGSGKSAGAKCLGQGLMENGFHCIYFDMNGEYYDWCQAVGGAYLDQRASTGTYIEPMEIRPKVSDRDDNPVDAMTARVTRTVSLLADTTDETLLVPCDQALLNVLKEMHIDRDDPDSWYKNKLRMTDWYAALGEIHTPASQDLRNKVFRFFEGTQRHLFGKSEPLNLDSQLAVIRLANPQEEGDDARASLVKMTMALDAVLGTIKRNKLRGEWYTAVILDELQRSIRNPVVERFVNTTATSIRHQNGLLITATNLADVYLGDHAPAASLWNNSYIKMMFWVEDKEMETIKKSKAIPDSVVKAIQESHGEHSFMLKVADKHWEQAKFQLTAREKELYATRGTKNKKG